MIHRGRGGFTLVELLVVIIVLFVLALLAVPVINKTINDERITSLIINGKQLYVPLAAQEPDNPLGLTGQTRVDWPQSSDVQGCRYATSSDFFATLVESNILDVTYGFFGKAGTGVRPSRDRAEFTDGTMLRNVWCITLDVSANTKPGTPVLFTQNFKFKSRSRDASLDQMIGLESNARPFGNQKGFVIFRDGAGLKLDAKTATPTNFNPTGATNGFLWTLASGQDVSGR